VFDQRGELPLLPFGNPIGFVPASRGGVTLNPKISETATRQPTFEIPKRQPAGDEYPMKLESEEPTSNDWGR